MRIVSKSACRVDVAGGTLDIWPLYLYHANACTVHFAVDRYREDSRIVLRSRDLVAQEQFGSLAELSSAKKYKLPLLAELVRFFAPPMGIDLDTDSEAPAGAGISGSSSLIITLASAFNRLLGKGYAIEALRNVAQNIEARIIKVPTGCQDYYPAMYGGVGALELRVDGIRRVALPVDHEDLISRTVLAYTGEPRNSGINNCEVTKLHIDGGKQVHRNFDMIAGIAHAMRSALRVGDWAEAGRLLREEWSFRKKNAPGICTPLIDEIVKVAPKGVTVRASDG